MSTTCAPTTSTELRSCGWPFDDSGVGFLGVANLARFVDGFMRQADVGDADSFFRFGRSMLIVGASPHLPAFLRGVVFIGEAYLRMNSRGPVFANIYGRLRAVMLRAPDFTGDDLSASPQCEQ